MTDSHLGKRSVAEAPTTHKLCLGVLLALAGVLCIASMSASSALADPTYGVMNAEGGIYWRSGPDWNTAVAVGGFGFYPNTVIEVHCYQSGAGNVPGSTDSMWEQATDVGGSGYGSGWINEHFINDGQPINQPSPGVPQCGSAGPPAPSPSPSPSPPAAGPPAPSGVPALYFSPYPSGSHWDLKDEVSKNIGSDKWSIGQCRLPDLPYVAGTAALSNGTPQVLAGWSLGRVGAISYLIDASVAQKLAIEYMILIDPGAYGEMSCDRTRDLGEYLVNWLEINPRAHLVVISGAGVTQNENSKGIQEVYFNPIRNADKAVGHRGGDLSSRVLTCNYTFKPSGGLTGHEEAYFASRYWIQHQIGSTKNSCPWLSLGATTYKPTAGWHP